MFCVDPLERTESTDRPFDLKQQLFFFAEKLHMLLSPHHAFPIIQLWLTSSSSTKNLIPRKFPIKEKKPTRKKTDCLLLHLRHLLCICVLINSLTQQEIACHFPSKKTKLCCCLLLEFDVCLEQVNFCKLDKKSREGLQTEVPVCNIS